MALSDHKYNASSSLYPDDTPNEFLHQFERETLDPQSAASDSAVFAYAIGHEAARQTFTTQEREDAKQFLTESFEAAGMSGKITTGDEYQPSVLPLRISEYSVEADFDEWNIFEGLWK
jgi:ABC-type branched-subunit amino acid transport system substrate-binding protein